MEGEACLAATPPPPSDPPDPVSDPVSDPKLSEQSDPDPDTDPKKSIPDTQHWLKFYFVSIISVRSTPL